jgi:hypothetical protein
MYIYMYVYIYMNIFQFISTTNIDSGMCIYTCIYMYIIYIYICIYLYTYRYIYLYIYITINIDLGTSEWDHLLSLDTIVKNAEESGQLSSSKSSPIPSITTRAVVTPDISVPSENTENSMFSDFTIDETMAELLRAFGEQDRQSPTGTSCITYIYIFHTRHYIYLYTYTNTSRLNIITFAL